MGQAKARKSRELSREEIEQKVDISRLAEAIRRICTAASTSLGSDCYLHAWLARRFLVEHGVPAEIGVGNAAWRVGPGDGDVLSHVTPESKIDACVKALERVPGQRMGFMYHAWVLLGEKWIFDPTTYLIPAKAKSLDEMDGSVTSVEWGPDFIFEPTSESRSFRTVADAYKPCFFYKQDARMKMLIEKGFEGCEEDYAMVWMAYRNPQALVIGPNHTRPKMV